MFSNDVQHFHQLKYPFPVSKPLLPAFVDDAGAAQSIETDELPLDYGGTALFFAPRPQEWWSRTVNEMRYRSTVPAKETVDFWEEEVKSNLAKLPPVSIETEVKKKQFRSLYPSCGSKKREKCSNGTSGCRKHFQDRV